MNSAHSSFNASLIGIGALSFLLVRESTALFFHLMEYLVSFEGLNALGIFIFCKVVATAIGTWLFLYLYRQARVKGELEPSSLKKLFIRLILWSVLVVAIQIILPIIVGFLYMEFDVMNGYWEYRVNIAAIYPEATPWVNFIAWTGMVAIIFLVVWKGMKTPEKAQHVSDKAVI